MAILDARSSRIEPRIPFFTPVVATGLTRCWATNISSNGIGLTAYVADAGTVSRGDHLELELELGESKRTLRAVGRVMWTSMVRADGRLGLGVQFVDLAPQMRANLARFLVEHRPRVMVALASPEEQAHARRALAHLEVEAVSSADELDEALVRACASILVFSSDERVLMQFLDALWRSHETSTALPGELPIAPVTLCTELESERLLPLFKAGRVYDVLRPPLDRRHLAHIVDRSCERWALQLELRWASMQLEGMTGGPRAPRSPRETSRSAMTGKVVRASQAMQRVYELIETVAIHDVPVLLTGETGTGKELAAREIHARSKRANTPFVAQDCGALTETLLESELFGHVRGAFTGATTDHPGLFQIADGGTIFLDEIQNTSPALQAKLLRVVEEGEVRPVGSAKPRQVNVRLIAACNVDLKQAVKEQRFRADFFYRLNRFPIELPPLREHREDIVPLIRHFIPMLCEQMDRPEPEIDPRVERLLVGYDWPGNIRELRNVVERALLLTPPGEVLGPEVLPTELHADGESSAAESGGLEQQLDAYERRLIKDALDRNNGVIRRAARDLSVNAVTLARRMRRLGLD